jgi:hypothetical protein
MDKSNAQVPEHSVSPCLVWALQRASHRKLPAQTVNGRFGSFSAGEHVSNLSLLDCSRASRVTAAERSVSRSGVSIGQNSRYSDRDDGQ